MNARSFRRSVLLSFFALSFIPLLASGAPVSMDFKVLLDTDNRSDTGCSVLTSAGQVQGIEHVLTTSVNYDAAAGTAAVTGVTRQTCSDAAANTLSAPTTVDAIGWPVGVSPSGELDIETHMPMSVISPIGTIRLAFTAASPTASDALVLDHGVPITWPPPPRRRHAVGDGTTRIITLDGALGDWDGLIPIAEGTGDGPAALRFSSVRIFPASSDLFFALSVRSNPKAPIANPDAYSVGRGQTLNVAAPGVLSNDVDPTATGLTAALVAGPQHGTLTLNPDGSFTYVNDGATVPEDSFQYKASNSSGDSNTAQVSIAITGVTPPPTPHFTSANSARFFAGTANDFTVTALPTNPTVTISRVSGALPTGVGFAGLGSGAAHLFGTPVQGSGGLYPIVFKATNVVGSVTQNFTLTVCNVITVTKPAVTTATAGSPFSQSFTQTGAVGTPVFSIVSGTLPAGLTLTSSGTVSGTPTQTGTFSITVKVTDANGCSGTAATAYTLTVGCQTITVNNPATTTGTATVPFSQQFTATSAIGATTFSLNSGTLPTGLALAANGTLSGTPTVVGSFPITVKVTDGNGCSGVGPTYNLVIGCQTITVTNPATASGTAAAAFSQTFTQSGALGGATFSTASTLPTGLALSTAGVLSGTPTQTGTFPIVVTATDVNGCTGSGPTYNLVIACQTITVTNPSTATATVGTAFSQTFTQTGAIGGATFSTASTLPTGLALSAAGVLSGTPTQPGTFPIVVTVTDSNGCSGTGATYTLIVSCQTITVTNPATSTGVAAAAFSQTFTQSGALGGATFSTASTLPTGLALSAAGVLSGTPTQTGTFPIVVTVTDGNGCSGSGPTYTLTITCQSIAVTNPATNTATAGSPFSVVFTQSGGIGTTTFSTASALPSGLALAANGTLSGTPLVVGSFPIVVTATDANGCSGTGATYTLTIGCQTITVTNPATTTATAGTAFSQTFTESGAIGGATFSTASSLPSGLTLSSAGVLAGTPMVVGTFPIVVTVTDGNGCSGTGATYNLVISCGTITVTNPANSSATVSSPFSEQFTQSGAIGGATFSTASSLPSGITLSASGLLSGTPLVTGSFPIVVTVTDGNGCTGNGPTYTLVIGCQTISVTNPVTNSGVAAAPFSETFTQTGAVGGATFSTASTLPAGLSLSSAGVLSGTPTQTGTFPIVVTVTDGNGCTGTGATYTLTITCQTITVTNPATTNGTAGSAFSQTFTQSGAIGTATFTTASLLPAGLNLTAAGVLQGTPTVVGTFPIVVTVTDSNGCTGTGATYTLVIGCQTITVTNPANASGTAAAAFSETFTQSGAIAGATFSTASTLPAGLSLSSAGVLSGTPTQTGTFPIVVTVTDGNGCTGSGATYTLVINCQTITVTNPANTTGTVSSPFSEQFSQSGAIGAATFSTASSLPAGITLSSSGLLSGTPTVAGSFPIVVTVTDSNGCTGSGATYTLIINCQTITVTNPATTSGPAGTPFSVQFTQTGGVGTTTFSESGTLPTGLTFHTATGILDGTPSQGGTFPITVTATDSNGCQGTGPTYNLVITCPVITVTNPANTLGTAGTAFSETFTQSGGIGTITWSESGLLPTGITLNSATGVLSGTTQQVGAFPIFVTATDQNGCQGTGAQYNLTINCQTITVTNPGVTTGTVDAAFSQTFTAGGILGTATWSESGALPAGITLNSATGVLSGTPTVNGTFPITVTATDTNGCFGTSSYTLTINCQTITVTNPVTNSGTVDTPFSQTFTQSGAHGTATFSTSSLLPAGLTLSTAGLLAGTPTVPGTFPIVVTVTDANGCTGTGATYTLTIGCQTITVTNPANATGTTNALFSETFTQSGGHGTTTFSTASTLPSGFSLSGAGGVLSGTTQQHGSFPIVVVATDSNGCTGTGATYNLTINCQTITVTNPANTTGTVGAPFSETFTQSGALGGATFSTVSTLPTGLSLSAAGVLSGTPLQSGTFNIVVTVTDGNGCAASGPTYALVILCNVITVNNPGVSSGTAGVAFSQTFTQSGGNGTIAWSETGTLPSGITLNSSTGVLSGTTTQIGSFPITVTATDSNGCTGTGPTYTLTIACQTITVTNPGVNQGTAGVAFSQTFTATGILGTVSWSESGVLPTGISINATTGVLSGTTTQTGTFPITVTATDTNGCFGTSSYTLTIICQTITVTNPATTSGTAGVAFSQTFTASGILGTATWSESGALPTGISLNTATGVLSGTPTQTGSFPITVTATDTNGCAGTGATYTLVIVCPTITVTRSGGGSFPAGTFNVAYAGQSFTASGSNGTPYTFTVTVGALPTGLSLSTAGAISGTPTATGTFSFTVTATDAYSCTGTFATTIAIKPAPAGDSYSNLVNLTQEVITGGLTASPTTPFTFHSTKILANDLPAGGVTLTTGTFATTAGGSITIASDGTFIYTPPVGNLSSDTFTYTVSSDTGGTGTPTTNTATITLNLANRVWYVNPGVALAGDGRSNTPWNNTSLITGIGTVANDIIFIYNNNPNSAKSKITLTASGQQLIGQGVALVVNGFTLVTAGTAPTITNTTGAPTGRDVVVINSGNTIKGLTISSAESAASLITGAPAALNVTTCTLLPGGSMNGINLTGGSGTVALDTVTMTGTGSGDMIKSNTGTHAWTFTNSPMTQTAGRALNMTNRTGGSVTFDAASTITVTAGTVDGAINLSTNSGGETFTLPKITITTTGTARGFVASNSGTVTEGDNTSVLVAATAAALDFQNTTIGAAGLKFRSITSTGGTNGIIVNTTGASGSFTIAANGGTCSSSATCTGGSITGQSGAGISLASTLSPSIDRIFIQNTGGSGISGANGVASFTLTNSRIDNSGTAAGGQYVESNVAFNDAGVFTTGAVTGTVTITGNTLTNARRHGIGIENGNGTISNLLIQNNTLTSSTVATTSLGNAILVNQSGSATTTAHLTTGTISGNTINNFPSGVGIFVAGGSGNTSNATTATLGANGTPINITGNFINGGATKMGSNAISATFNGLNGIANFNISSNGSVASPLQNFHGHGVNLFMGGTVTGTTTVDSNRIQPNETTFTTKGIAAQVDDGPAGLANSAADYNFVITNNNISQTGGEGIRVIVRNSLGKLDATIQNNTVAAPNLTLLNGIRVDSGSTAGNTTLCMKMTGNTSAGTGGFGAFGIRKQGTVATTDAFGIHSLAGTSSAAVAQAQVSADNGGATVDVISGDNFVACTPTP